MTPKVIHYCWFGGNPLPDDAIKCMDPWKKYFPDDAIKEWNESNFDLNCCDYVREAYEAKKWAFVSDYARFWILYRYGGLYFDTNVEVIKDMRDIVEKGAFMGCEPTTLGRVNAAPGLDLYKEILEDYEKDHFFSNEIDNPKTVVHRVTSILVQHGWKQNDDIQCIDIIYIYSPDYFCPLLYDTGILTITKNTRSIHYCSATWLSGTKKKIHNLKRFCASQGKVGCLQEKLRIFPLCIKNKIENLGALGMLSFAIEKIGGYRKIVLFVAMIEKGCKDLIIYSRHSSLLYGTLMHLRVGLGV